jgi:hypothetical protein
VGQDGGNGKGGFYGGDGHSHGCFVTSHFPFN